MQSLACRAHCVTQHQEYCPMALLDWDHTYLLGGWYHSSYFVGRNSQVVRGQYFEGACFEEYFNSVLYQRIQLLHYGIIWCRKCI